MAKGGGIRALAARISLRLAALKAKLPASPSLVFYFGLEERRESSAPEGSLRWPGL